MSPVRIVPTLDEVEHSHLCLCLISKAFSFDEFTFERREEALTHGIVLGIAHRSHGRLDASLFAPEAKGNGGWEETTFGSSWAGEASFARKAIGCTSY